ncbi:cytochrome c oxidase subunit IV [bacterium]|nr:cytochrome c oxidase subunit IV [bacterium]
MAGKNAQHGAHGEHITPLRTYLAVGAALIVLTILTVGAIQFDFGSAMNLVIAMAIAVVKASLVALFFMHLLYDNKFYLFSFITTILFLGVFIILTMFDTMRRGDFYEEAMAPITPQAAMYESIEADTTGGHGSHGEGHGGGASHDDETGKSENKTGNH